MNAKMKKELINDVLTGLAVAAVFTAIAPVAALAQDLAGMGEHAESQLMVPFVRFVSYASYGMGTVMTVAGIASAKKHADNPGQNPLGAALGKLGAGAAFLTAPMLAATLASTSDAVGIEGTAGLNTMGGF